VRKAQQLSIALYISRHARPDVSTAIAFLTTRVRASDINNWRELSHLIKYLRVNRVCPLILSADESRVLMWYIDTSFAVHPNMWSHTGGGLTMGRGFSIGSSTKQKLNTHKSTESELVGVDNMMPIVLWSWYFLMARDMGYSGSLATRQSELHTIGEKW
jgi:hypothetical protein